MPRGRSREGLPAPSAESAGKKTKRERFLELAPKRTVKVLADLELLGRCSSPLTYEFNQLEVEKIFNAIAEKTHAVQLRFREKSQQSTESFTL
jgi:hypothetical protein